MKRHGAALALLVSGLLFLPPVSHIEAGQEFRGFNAIPSPVLEERAFEDLAADGYQPVSTAQNISTPMVEKIVYDLFESWNSHELGSKLSRDFPNKSRITDAIQTGVPRHVKLQVLSVQNPRIVKQYVRPHPSGDGTYQLLSKVSVRVYSQIAASTSIRRGFQRVEGVSDYLLNVTQKVKAA